MSKKAKTIISFLVFALFIGIAVFAYNRLSRDIAPQNGLDKPEDQEKQKPSQESQEPVRTSRPSRTPRQQEKESEEKQVPDFTVEDREGNPVKLSDLFGKPIVLNFWASWCPPCKKEMPEFEQAYKQMGEDITFIMVDLVDGRDETKAKGAQYIEEKGFSFPVYFDMEQEAAYAYGISSIPTTLFIDKDGFIVTGAYGMLDSERLQEGINRIR